MAKRFLKSALAGWNQWRWGSIDTAPVSFLIAVLILITTTLAHAQTAQTAQAALPGIKPPIEQIAPRQPPSVAPSLPLPPLPSASEIPGAPLAIETAKVEGSTA